MPSFLRLHVLVHSTLPYLDAMKIAVVGSGCTGLGATWVRIVADDHRKMY